MFSNLCRVGWPLALSALHRMDAEKAHNLSLQALKLGVHPKLNPASDPRLQISIAGLDFANPLGLAAGYDKNGEAARPLSALGFGLVEIGSVTPKPQAGNPKPRLFRLPEAEAVINRMGFNNDGLDKALAHARTWPASIVKRGINLGANKDSDDRTNDYIIGYKSVAPVADYITINISSPNTKGLRALQAYEALNTLLSKLSEAKLALQTDTKAPPLFLKLSPDMSLQELDDVLNVMRKQTVVDGLIVSNTTVTREGVSHLPQGHETGGLSGRPLMASSTAMLKATALRLEGALPLIGVGGIMSGADALVKIEAGASLIQVYSGLVYKGPQLIQDILAHLSQALDERKCDSISQLIGSGLMGASLDKEG